MITRRWHQLDRWLAGQPDQVVTLLLIGLSLAGLAIALWGPRPLKAGVLLWWLAP